MRPLGPVRPLRWGDRRAARSRRSRRLLGVGTGEMSCHRLRAKRGAERYGDDEARLRGDAPRPVGRAGRDRSPCWLRTSSRPGRSCLRPVGSQETVNALFRADDGLVARFPLQYEGPRRGPPPARGRSGCGTRAVGADSFPHSRARRARPAGPADPALDLVSAWHLLGAGPREALRDDLGPDDLEWERGKAWAFEQAMGLVWYYARSNATMAAIGRRPLSRLLETGT